MNDSRQTPGIQCVVALPFAVKAQHQAEMGSSIQLSRSFFQQYLADVQHPARHLLAWSDNSPFENWTYLVVCLLLTLMAGLMSGLTLGLLSLDTVELEVLLRSGTAKEQKYARKIMPIVSNTHFLLVTLLLCNAVAMEALPLFLDELADPVTAVIVSVTAVLFFGEIVPQSVCSRYGLAIGASLAPFVRLLMWLCSPVAWPTGKLLDLLLGADHHTLFRRRQLKELVSIHAEDAGMGGALTRDEIKVITGALDLTSKVAYRAMTPLDKVFMLSSSDRLDEATLRAVLRSGHSRIPVHAAGERSEVVGLLLVKELLQYRLGSSEVVPVSMLRTRSIPRLPATTPMYDMLRLFQTGRSHIAVLTQPPHGELRRQLGLDATARRAAERSTPRSGRKGQRPNSADGSGGAATGADSGPFGHHTAGVTAAGAAGADLTSETPPGGMMRADRHDDVRSVAGDTEAGYGDAEGYTTYGLYGRMTADGSTYAPSALEAQYSYGGGSTAGDFMTPLPLSRQGSGAMSERMEPLSRQGSAPEPLLQRSDEVGTSGELGASSIRTSPEGAGSAASGSHGRGGYHSSSFPRSASVPTTSGTQYRRTRMGLEADAAAAAAAGTTAASSAEMYGSGGGGFGGLGSLGSPGDSTHGAGSVASALEAAAAAAAGEANGGGGAGPNGSYAALSPLSAGATAAAGRHCGAHDEGCGEEGFDEDAEEPEEGRPIGIITIEDVIEELIRTEIVDETDRYVDNNRLIRVNPVLLAQALPEHLAKVLAVAGANKKAAAAGGGFHRGSAGHGRGWSHAGGPSASASTWDLSIGEGAGLLGGFGQSHQVPFQQQHYNQQQQQQQQQQNHSSLRVPLLQTEQV